MPFKVGSRWCRPAMLGIGFEKWLISSVKLQHRLHCRQICKTFLELWVWLVPCGPRWSDWLLLPADLACGTEAEWVSRDPVHSSRESLFCGFSNAALRSPSGCDKLKEGRRVDFFLCPEVFYAQILSEGARKDFLCRNFLSCSFSSSCWVPIGYMANNSCIT